MGEPSPVLIHLDSPTTGAVVPRQPFIVAGWALDPAAPLVAVVVGIDRELWAGTRMGIRRPDVAQAYPDLSGADLSGWRAELDLTDWSKERVEISVIALRRDRTWWMEIPATVELREPGGRVR
jgi:hypothetical protein